MFVVIPCYREPDMLRTLKSLSVCDRGNFKTEVIVVVNSYQIDSSATIEMNRRTMNEIFDFAAKCNLENFVISPILVENLPGHQTGAGIPRKIGMDEAIRNAGDDKMDIIVSLDADCTVEKNYLTEIYKQFKQHRLNSATISFHHPVDHLPVDSPLRIATVHYEKYLRYYRTALEYTGYPYPFYTVGSAFAITVETYRKVGGMGRQQSGEDFYFLQKVFPLGHTKYIDTTTVYPEARPSDRVPFGTGPALKRALESGELTPKSYNPEAFRSLRSLFSNVNSLFRASKPDVSNIVASLPPYLASFLEEDLFENKIAEINRYTASVDTFRKRFFDYFNAFKIIKYLNFAHSNGLKRVKLPDDVFRYSDTHLTLHA